VRDRHCSLKRKGEEFSCCRLGIIALFPEGGEKKSIRNRPYDHEALKRAEKERDALGAAEKRICHYRLSGEGKNAYKKGGAEATH